MYRSPIELAFAIQPFITDFIAAFEQRSPLRGILVNAISAEARRMYTTILDELLAEGEARGKAEGRAEALLLMMAARGLVNTEAQRQRVEGCRSEALLQRWLDPAARVGRADDVFTD